MIQDQTRLDVKLSVCNAKIGWTDTICQAQNGHFTQLIGQLHKLSDLIYIAYYQ